MKRLHSPVAIFLALFGLASPVEAEEWHLTFDGVPGTLGVAVPDGFHLAYVSGAYEFIPVGEEIDHWSLIFTFSVFELDPQNIEAFRAEVQQNFFSSCQKDAGRKADFPLQVQNGRTVAEYVEICDMTISGPSKGNPEGGVYRIVAGPGADFAVSMAARHIPTDQEIKQWRALLARTGWLP